MIRFSFKFASLVAMLAITAGAQLAYAQEEEDAEDVVVGRPQAGAAVMKLQQANIDQQVDQWVFNRFGGAVPARTKLESALVLRIDDLDRVCTMTEVQKHKLKLAGQGDIKRFFDRVAELKRKVGRGQPDPNQNIWQEVQPLQNELNTGLFGDESLFAKTIKRTLDSAQTAQHDTLVAKRRQVRHRATAEWFVVHVDKALGLTEDQRRKFIDVLVALVPPPQKFGQADYWYFMLQSARVPEDKLKPIFDAPQWRLLSRQFTQARGMEAWLKQSGVLPGDAKDQRQAPALQPSRVVGAAPPF
jgi:hypothetical protein